jgi:serine/threonine-protein kinase
VTSYQLPVTSYQSTLNAEKLPLSPYSQMDNPINIGEILSDRYRIIKQLGQGGFGRTYLAEDLNRFHEYCVLKEFAPLMFQGTAALHKAAEMFEREAGILYKLQHPQIPRFRELFRVKHKGKGRLFLVQDYVEGQSYRNLLRVRQSQGLGFTEADVTQLLLQILPVLEYIHLMGVIHRDISPDNIILRASDLLPVLIDFGGVKQLAVDLKSQLVNPKTIKNIETISILGKAGYAPVEQMQKGIVFPHSDLYALAATVLVLLTGKEPQQLMDSNTLAWKWQDEVNLSPKLTKILERMLSKVPKERFQVAREVMEILDPTPIIPPDRLGASIPVTSDTRVINSGSAAHNIYPPTEKMSKIGFLFSWFSKISLVLALILGSGLLGWFAGNYWVKNIKKSQEQNSEETIEQPTFEPKPLDPTNLDTPSPSVTPTPPSNDLAWRSRIANLGINNDFFVALTNDLFWQKYPSEKGRVLTDKPEDLEWQKQSDNIANELVEKLSKLSPEALKGLGSYDRPSRAKAIEQVNQLNLSSRALYDLVDAEFFSLFGKADNLEFDERPISQVSSAIVFDKVRSLQSAKAYERVVFPKAGATTELNGTLEPGQGKAFVISGNFGQSIGVQLEADSTILISFYSPTGKVKILEDSTLRQWSGKLPESGYYEIIVVSRGTEPLEYQLSIETK